MQDNDRSDLDKHHRQRWETHSLEICDLARSCWIWRMQHISKHQCHGSFWEGNTRINSTSLVRQETKSTYLGSSTLASTTQWISLIGQLQFSVIILRMQWIILQDLQAMTYFDALKYVACVIFSRLLLDHRFPTNVSHLCRWCLPKSDLSLSCT